MRDLQRKIIAFEKVSPKIDPAYEVKRSVTFLKEYLQNAGLYTYVLGISGGQDSTLAGKLTQMAINELRQSTHDMRYQFIAIRLPYGKQLDDQDAQEALQFIKPDKLLNINIKPSVDALTQTLQQSSVDLSDFNRGNVKARLRMTVQYAVAGQYQGLVVGTDHAAENVTGFFTKFGDGGADVMPLFRLDKRQGRQMLAYLNAPRHLYEKVPTADLEDNKPLYPDEQALGISYDMIDDYLEGKTIPVDKAQYLENLYLRSQHKRQMLMTIFDLKKDDLND